jgi:hypothetical protein
MKFKAWFAVLACALIFSCSGSPVDPGKNRTEGKGKSFEEDGGPVRRSKTVSSKKKSAAFPELNLDFLFKDKAPAGEAEVQRNMVAMEEDPVVVAERKKRDEEARKQAEEAAKKAAEERKKLDEELAKNPPPPQPPAIPFDFIGYMGPVNNHIGIFRIGGKDDVLLLCKKGEKIDKEFRVIEIGYESAEIGFEGFKETKTIPLVAGGK